VSDVVEVVDTGETPRVGTGTATGWQPEPAGSGGEHKAETRRRLLDAASEVFMALGPAEASLGDVAARAEVGVDTLELYFGSRHELMNELARHLYLRCFRRYPSRHDGTGLTGFLRAYLEGQVWPENRLIWRLGDVLTADSPEGPDDAYWHLIAEIEKRLVDDGVDLDEAHGRALVLAPALLLVARRASFDLATEVEIENFVVAASRCAGSAA
jgi:AcrR family transcriptional regulator